MATKKETKVKDIDITKSGPMTYRNLQAANAAQYTNLSPEMQAFSKEVEASTAPTSLYDARNQGESLVRSSLSNTSTTWGESIYDNPTATEEQFQNLGDIRAENEPWYAKIAAGIGKGAILTGTTFLDGIVGLLFGTGTAITEGRWSGLWDNDFSKAMQAINEKSEEWMPNYYTQKEQETPWYENIFTANFLGDKFIKNLGFTIGAFYSGGVTAAGLKVTKLPQLIGAITKMTKAPAMVTSTVGAVTSAVNEGRIEALNNSKDWFNLHKAQLDDNYKERIQRLQSIYEDNKGSLVKTKDGNFIDPAYLEYQKALQKERESYNSALGKLSEDRLKMGNVDLLMNLPILTASNIIQFGKMYANGFKTARKATNIVGRAGEYSTSKSTLGNIWNVSKGALSEGGEEISQKAASTISGNYYETDVNNYYKAKTDPKASQDTLSWTKAFAQGINETVNEGSSWEEFFTGALTGALGMPKFRSMKNAEGKFQSPITIEGGAINEWREYNEKKARDQELADALNARVNSPEFRNYYQGLIRHNKYQGDMNQAAENNDEFSFKNAEHAQLVSDISMFDNAGKLEDLYTLLDASFDTSDENLRAIAEHTTSTQENGEKVGPFVDSKGNPMYATPEGKEEMIKKLTENKEEITNTIKEYLKIKNDIDSRTGEQLTDDQLEELTWMRSQLGNWSKRSVEMSADVKKAISSIIGNLSPLLQFYEAVRDSEGKSSADLTETYREADENIQFLNKVIGTLDKVRNYSNEALAAVLAQNSKYVDFLIKELNKVDDSSVSKEDKDSTIAKLKDIQKLGNASKIYNEKLNEYLKNPQKQAEDHVKADKEAATQESKKKSDDLKASLKNAKNVREFREILDKEDDEETRNKVLKELEDEDNKLAKNHKELNQYHREVQRAINESDAEPQAKQDALTLLRDQYNNSEDLQQVANPNSIYVNNTNAFDEESEGDVELSATRFTNAQYELQRAMSKVNNDIKFKDRFSPEYRRPVENNKNSISNTIETRSGKKVTGTYKKTTDTDGFTHVKYEGPGIARFRIKSGDYGISLDDLIGSKDEYESEDSYNEVVADATSDGLQIGNSTLRPDGSVSIETENGITIEGDAAKLIYDKLFNPTVRGDDRINTGSDATSTTPPVGNNNKGNNKGGKPKTDDELDAEETNGTAVGNVTKEMVAEENKATNARVESPQVKKGETKKYYRPAIPELHIEASKDGDFRAFDIVVKEKEGADFSEIYNYLRDKGVFEYLNSGKLKVGDDIGFMIDPEFEKKVEGQEWHKAPTIFLINKKDGQIVGSLDEGSSITNFEGLAGLEERIRKEYNQRNSQPQPQQRQFKTDYQYDKEMSFYGGQVHGTLDRVENGTAIYVDSKGQPTILLAGKSDHQFIGIFREPNSNRWSIKMENKEGDKTIFRDMMSSVMAQLPLGAEIYERTSISVDGLRVFAQQLNHGFEIGNETYETDINGGDIANIFGLSKADQEAMGKVHISEKELPKVKEILRPYLEKFGVKDIDKVVYLTNGNTLSVKLPILVKTKQTESQRSSQSQQEQSKLGELRTIKKTVVGTSSNYEVEVYETPISLKDAEPNTTIISPKGDKQLLVISNNKEEGYLIVKNILGGKEQLYDYTGNKKGTLPAWVDSKGDTKVYVLAKFQSTNQDISQFADNELVEFASTQNTGFHTTSEGKSSLKEKITDIGKEEAGWGSVNGITYYKVNVGGRNDYVAAYFRTEPTSEIKKAVEAILNDSNLDYSLAQKKIADLIRNNSVSNQITDISKAEKDDLIYITNTSQGYSSLGNMQEWSQKVSDIRKFPDGFGTHNGLFYYKHSDKGGRVGDNITIWFRNEPSQRVKDSIESLLNSSKNLIEFGDKVVKLLKEDNANLINNSNATQTNTQTSVNSNKPFIASPTTKVSKVMVGKIPYRNSERSLKDIPKVTTDDHKPLFGIIKNGVLVTNNKVADNLIIKPMDMSKEGRLYLLVPNGAGKYSPVAVRVKHFNDEEFNLNDKEIAETPLGKSIIGGINKLVQSTSQDDVSNAMKDLAKNLHLQDVIITWFEGNKGSGIVISKKVKNADGSYKKTTINGKEQIVEEKTDIYFNTKAGVINTGGLEIEGDAAAQLGIDTSDTGKPKDSDAIYNEILNALLKLNVPLQVSARRINDGAYNARLINSNILTSNISEAATKGTWFTTDHFDDNGNLQKANNPQSVPKPKKGTGNKGAIIGTRVYFGKQTYYVNLENNTITNSKGKSIEINDSNRILLDIAWANSTFGNARVSTNMINNKVITPSGRILDRDTNKYLTGEAADSIRSQIEAANKGRKEAKAKTQKTIDEIYENQKKVDKLKTDGDFYYILEDDGEYHPYDRVHSRLGSNWKESIKQKKALDLIKYNLSKQSDDISLYNNYLDYLKRHYKEYKIDFDQYKGKTDVKTREAIVNTIRDAMSNTNSQRALAAGTAIDSVIRQFFTIKDISKITKPDNLTEQAYVDLITTLNEIKENIERLGETFLADNIVLFQKYPDGTRVAGEVDILAVDKNGNFKIYDVKTSRYSFHDFTDKYGHKVNYFRNASRTQTMSTEAYYTLQLSAYKNLFESQYGVPITSLALMPFVLSYDKENRVTNIQSEKGISIAYNPAVNVPLIGNVQSTNLKPQGQDITQKGKGSNNQDNSNQGNNNQGNQGNQGTQNNTDSRFNNSLESLNPVNDVDDNHKFEDGNTIGYFELNGKLHKGYLKELTTINGYKIYLTKVPNLTKGFGKSEEHVASNNYYAIFPNGKVYEVARNVPITENTKESYMADEIKNLLSKNPKKVADLSTEKTLLFDPKTTTNTTTNTEIKLTIPSTENTANTETIKGKEGTGGAAAATAKLQAVNDNDEDYEDEFELRKVDDISRTVWNQERELKWLNKVLPNLSTSDRVKVVKGLIEVGSKGTKAWGKFSKGIITLSDIAAEGTTYHEAFHAVFNLLLDNNERQALYDEARKLYGEKDNLSLEEDMAEGFREYVMTRQNAGLLSKIKNFFKDLWVKVTNWNKIQPHLMAYYQMINNGKYNNREVEIESIKDIDTRYKEIPNSSFEKLDSNYQESLLKKGWTEEKFNSISQEERDNAIKCVAF